jgi:hypothetical protein
MKNIIILFTFLLAACSTSERQELNASFVPVDYHGKPFHDNVYTQGAQEIPGRVELAFPAIYWMAGGWRVDQLQSKRESYRKVPDFNNLWK